MLGGFVTSAVEDGRVYAVKKPVSDGLRFCAFVPDFELLTEKARAALPAQIPHRDAVYNVSRAALMAAAFCEGRPELLRVGAQDRLHQPYRLPLIPGAEQVIGIAAAQGGAGWLHQRGGADHHGGLPCGGHRLCPPRRRGTGAGRAHRAVCAPLARGGE